MRTSFRILLLLGAATHLGCASEAVSPPPRPLRVAGLMIVPVKWDKQANTERLDAAIREAKRQGADVVVTPEGALEGYVVNEVIRATGQERRELTIRFNALAEPCDGPYIQHFRQLSKELGIYLILGFLEDEGANTRNTAILIRPDGAIGGKYHKTHLAQGYSNGDEKGDNPPGYLRGTEYPTFALGPYKVGIMICYDRQVPGVAERLARNGAEIILNPSYGMVGDCNREFISARASENRVPILFVHPQQMVFGDAQGGIQMDVRPGPGDPRLAIVSLKIADRLAQE